MNLIGFIFHIGIVFITFHFLWWLFMFCVKMAIGVQRQALIQKVEGVLKPIGLLLLVAVSAIKAHEMSAKSDYTWTIWVYAGIGAFLVYAYVLERMRKNAVNIRIVNGKLDMKPPQQSTSDKIMLAVLSGLFIAFIIWPQIIANTFTLWLSKAINDVYETPVIGWIIAIMGAFFLLRMIFVAFITINQLLDRGNRAAAGSKGMGKDYQDDDGFVDYEIVDDEPDEPTKGGFLN